MDKKQQVIASLQEIMNDFGGWPINLPPMRNAAKFLREQYPDWVWPGSKEHIVSCALDTNDIFKVFSEPGGCFSPGVMTFGVAPWVLQGQTLYHPENLSQEQYTWGLQEGCKPVVTSGFAAGDVWTDTALVVTGAENMDEAAAFYKVKLSAKADISFCFVLSVRWIGAAGNRITEAAYDEKDNVLRLNKKFRVVPDRKPDRIVVASLEQDGQDISVMLREGNARALTGREQSLSGIMSLGLVYDITLKAGEETCLSFICPLYDADIPSYAQNFEQAQAHELQTWQNTIGKVEINTPDEHVNIAAKAIMTHIRWWMVHKLYRHSPVTYPLFWLRDAAMMGNIFDKFGMTDISQKSAEHICENMFMTGFGTEADSPGESLWYLAQYFRFTHNKDWLAQNFVYIGKKAELIMQMMDADKTLRDIRETVLPLTHFHPDGDLLCEKSDDGLIVGRMDWHRPLLWVNMWSLIGLQSAQYLAEVLGKTDDAAKIGQYAARLEKRINEYAEEKLGDNERDFACLVWPTRAFAPDRADVIACYEDRWERIIDEHGKYTLKTEWTYFDMADAHNRLYMGQKDRLWDILSYYLNHQQAAGMYLWKEGPQWHADRSTTWSRVAGWIDHPTIVPHGWIASEVVLLIRDLFMLEEGEHLVLGAGLKDEWLAKGQPVSIRGFYTYWGELSYRISYEGDSVIFDIDAPRTLPGFEIRLPGYTVVQEKSTGITVLDEKSWAGCPHLKPEAAKLRVVLQK